MGILKVDAFPCAWPIGWPRTPPRKRTFSRYRTGFVESRDRIVRRLKRLGAREIVVSSNQPLRRDGLPSAVTIEPEDPAVAVYWADGDGSHVIACDRWRKLRENMRAVDVSIDALQALRRAGATQILERAYAGFAVLAADNPRQRPWREVFGVPADYRPQSFDELKSLYHRLLLRVHPDVEGGSADAMKELMTAYVQAVAELRDLPDGWLSDSPAR